MNKLDEQYLDLLKDILENGTEKTTRNGKTLSVFGKQIRHKMSEGFPALTTKKLAFKTMVVELLWFLRGDTNIKYLVDNDCHIWDGDAYQAYLKWFNNQSQLFTQTGIFRDPWTKEQYIEQVKLGNVDTDLSDLGPIYGKQWRSWGRNATRQEKIVEPGVYTKQIDQIQNLINDLKTNPDSRRLMVNALNVGELDQMVLPPCHYGFQVYTRELSLNERVEYFEKLTNTTRGINWDWTSGFEAYLHEVLNMHNIPTRAISLMFNMRSTDVPLGLPFNIASYGLLLEILAKEVSMVPDELIANLGDAHIYSNQIDGVTEQLTREPFELPELKISDVKVADISHYEPTNFELVNYQSHAKIFLPLSN